MPFYEYECNGCGEQVEALQKMSDPLLVDCPACNKPELRKKISAAGFRLKGAGWYETDFKSDNKRNVVESGEAKTSKDESKADGKNSENSGSDKAKSDSGKADSKATKSEKSEKSGKSSSESPSA